MKDYKEKIKKLLALAESNNEHEAKAALLKAKELMAEYKIEEIDLIDAKSRKVKRIYTQYEYTKRGEWWIGSLAQVIAGNYCCRCASNIPHKGAQKRQIYRGVNLSSQDKNRLKNSYAIGFSNGVHEAFEVQKAEKAESGEAGWGLVMVIPQEVNDDCKGFRTDRYISRNRVVYRDAKAHGYDEGRKFNPNGRLGGAQ